MASEAFRGFSALQNRFAVCKDNVLRALVLLAIIEVLCEFRTNHLHTEDVAAGDGRLKSLRMALENAVSLRLAQAIGTEQELKWRTPQTDMRLGQRNRRIASEIDSPGPQDRVLPAL